MFSVIYRYLLCLRGTGYRSYLWCLFSNPYISSFQVADFLYTVNHPYIGIVDKHRSQDPVYNVLHLKSTGDMTLEWHLRNHVSILCVYKSISKPCICSMCVNDIYNFDKIMAVIIVMFLVCRWTIKIVSTNYSIVMCRVNHCN